MTHLSSFPQFNQLYKNPSYEIAKTIRFQLYSLGGFMKIGSWGSHNFIAIKKGLQFKVNARHFQGYIHIILDEAQDLYNIEFWHVSNQQLCKHQYFIGIYADQLVEIIDKTIEYIPAYRD